MNKQYQWVWVVEQLEKNGSISRNQCLSRFITRLSSIIFRLEEQGYKFETSQRNKKDFIYTAVAYPKK